MAVEKSSEGAKPRRMMGVTEKHPITTPKPIEAPAPSPSPAPKTTPNRALRSKQANYLGKLLSESIRVVINKTKIRLV